MDLRYAGSCCRCDEVLPAGSRAFYDPADRSVCCTSLVCAEQHGVTEERWQGSPTGGQYVTVLAEHRLGGHPTPGAPGRVVVTRFAGGGTSYRNSRGRCEDAPCCGCCS